MKYGDAIRAALDEASAVTGAVRDALDEALHGEGTPATDRAIQSHIERAIRHAPKLTAALHHARGYQPVAPPPAPTEPGL